MSLLQRISEFRKEKNRATGLISTLLVLCVCLISQSAQGASLASVADATPVAVEVGDGKWVQGVYQGRDSLGNAAELPYQFFIPEQRAGDIPLVVFLHGSGEAGTDNQKQLYADRNVGPTFFAQKEIQKRHQAFVLAPQTPEKIRWASNNLHEYNLDETPITVSMKLMLELADQLIEKHQIDQSRIYVGGLSRGGQGAWNAILQRPNFFAAAFPMCGSGSLEHAGLISHLAIWAFHGQADAITPLRYTRRMIAAVMAAGGSEARIRKTEYENGRHSSAWLQGHNEPDFADWIFKWRNPNTGASETTRTEVTRISGNSED